MKKVTISIALIIAMIAITPFASVSASTDTINRGEFFKLVVDHLEYDGSNVNVELPSDVAANSPFANTVKVLKQKKIVVGFPDGSFKLDQKITPVEASAVISRILALKGEDVSSKLAANYGVRFGDEKYLTSATAKAVVTKALTSDKSARELMDKMAVAQNEQISFKATSDMSMIMDMNLPDSESDGVPNPITLDGSITMIFNKEKGMYQQMKISMPLPEQQEVSVEQYFVPEGIFMKIKDPITGQDQWMNMSEAMPFDFIALMEMNEENLKMSQDLNNKYFIYKDLGLDEIAGKQLQKIIFSGKIDSIEEVLGMMGNMLGDQSVLSSLEGLPNMTMSMNGTVWIDKETSLPYRQLMDYEIVYGQSNDPAMASPIEKMNYELDMIYSDFGQVNEIVLPEEALSAEVLPGLNQLEELEDAEYLENVEEPQPQL
ncbi:S-layer homology domain-containing protein [Bacillus sp. Marseille-P3661]|uniref:S-layer homology domain-containing protein n=1 Tax=Bacillus sp. Marseille-P3661 TaxID=1936234 RepID=UPI000C8619E3|nr:S-layer homology domain-containing protein [Bacillus sp. Marseille-P3661]